MPANDEVNRRQNLCGQWMPRAQAYCARGAGHRGDCRTPEFMERQRERARAADRPYDPIAARRWHTAHRLTRYGLTPETFEQKLADQGYACGMCLQPFKDGQIICIDHDHSCCPGEKKSCGRCVRGLLCRACNWALGLIEAKDRQAHQYLERWGGQPDRRLVDRGELVRTGEAAQILGSSRQNVVELRNSVLEASCRAHWLAGDAA